MPLKKQNKKSNGKPKRQRAARAQNSMVSRALTGLDAGARAYRQLLLDPCNAPLVGPAYDGTHSGVYRRYRRIYSIPAAEVETVYVWQPGTNTIWQGGHSTGSAGGAITFIGGVAFSGPSITSEVEGRCLSACVKVRYTGAESARAGVVGLSTGGYYYSPSLLGVTVVGAQGIATQVARLGELQHEVKFVPMSGDQEKTPVSIAGSLNPTPTKSCILITLRGVPAGAVQLELTSVMELDTTDTGAATGTTGLAATIEPASSNTLNQVLRTLGPAASWAFHNLAVPTIRSITTGVHQSVASSSSMAMAGMRLLTL